MIIIEIKASNDTILAHPIGHPRRIEGGEKMKVKSIILICTFLLIILIQLGSCATKQMAISHENAVESFSGTWVNHDNPIVRKRGDIEFFHFQKKEISLTDVKFYHSAEDSDFYGHAKYTVVNSWVDRIGNTYCQTNLDFFTGSRMYALWKLDKSKNVFEESFYYQGAEEYPTRIITHDVIEEDIYSPTGNLYYNIFYRQE